MPQVTYPNQRMINIHRERATSNFLGIKNDNWMAASRALGAHALRLYLYLAANRDGYTLALSPAAIQEAIGMPASTYRDQFRKLQSLGYIENVYGNTYDFYEIPRATPPAKDSGAQHDPSMIDFEGETAAARHNRLLAEILTAEDREINNSDTQQIGESINIAAASSRVQSGRRAEDVWPEDWWMFASKPDQIIPEEKIAEIKAWQEAEAKRPPDNFEPKPGAFDF